jgi:ATP-binding protein involved in chromosome partitioning
MNNIKNVLSSCNLKLFGLSIKVFLSNIKVDTLSGIENVNIILGFPLRKKLQKILIVKLKRFLHYKFIDYRFDISVSIIIDRHRVTSGQKPWKSIKNIIAVASGKGGVGKSVTTSNLARSLFLQGASVGILDADIHGPSQPSIMKSFDRPFINDNKKIQPLVCDGIKVISIGNLIDLSSAMIWRGPMVSSALMQLLQDTDWGKLDYLFIDLPPGTGDISLTMVKNIPITAVVIISTSHDLSIMDVRRSIAMFKKVNINIAGIINNMSTYMCECCGYSANIFSDSSIDGLLNEFAVTRLGDLPLDLKISSNRNFFTDNLNSRSIFISKIYEEIALKITSSIAMLPKALTSNIPSVKVEYVKQ